MAEFGTHVLLTERLSEDEARVVGESQLTMAARMQGVDLDLSTLNVQMVGRGRINGEVLLTEEEMAAGMTGDEVLLRASARLR